MHTHCVCECVVYINQKAPNSIITPYYVVFPILSLIINLFGYDIKSWCFSYFTSVIINLEKYLLGLIKSLFTIMLTIFLILNLHFKLDICA